MTTIAYKDGIIAYDGLVCRNGLIVRSDYPKKVEECGHTFFCTGSLTNIGAFIYGFLENKKVRNDNDITALIVFQGKVYFSSSHNCIIFREDAAPAEAIGSGQDFALAYMDVGLSAAQAVKKASERDLYTGGKISTFKVNNG